MRIIKAEIVGHFDSKGNRYAVYSMDVQPNSNRLATGGGDCCIKLWNFDALLSSPTNAKEALLATLSSHTKSVNVVRWSRDGKLLASGSDDNYILIHKYTPGALSNQSFGSSAAAVKNKETWSRCYSLQGHSMDILDLDWLPGSVENGYTLASASVDNRIMIWNVAPAASAAVPGAPSSHAASSTLVSPKQILSGHDSFVKGLSYDPMGRYLISSGSDNRLIVWDLQNEYAIVRTLDDPLRNSPDKTIFRRISWSPDGQSVCITSAQKSNKPVGMVLKRGTWESVADLVGHGASSISARFCPHVLQYVLPNTTNATAAVSCAVALGDQNGVVSIWSTHSNRPMYVLRDVCEGAVTDIAWARNAAQTAVAICGIDGNVVLADFAGELGKCMPPALLEKHFQSLYGRNMAEMQQRPQVLVESALALKYAQMPAQLSAAATSAGSAVPAANGAGKKRIVLNANGTSVDVASASSTLNGAAAGSAPGGVGSSPMSSLANRSSVAHSRSDGDLGNAARVVDMPSAPAVQLQQQVSHTVGGKKRIRPVLMQNNLDTPDEVTAAVVGSTSSSSSAAVAATSVVSTADSTSTTIPAQTLARSVSFPARPSSYMTGGDGENGFASAAESSGQPAKRLRQASEGPPPSAFNGSATGRSTPTPVGSNNTARPAVATERFMTIQFDHEETLCTVPLLGAQQRIRKFVRSAVGARSGTATAGLSAAVAERSFATNRAGQYVVTAQRLTKPSVLAQLRHSGGPMSAVSLTPASAAEAGDNTSVGQWTAVVTGEVTCVAAAQGSSPRSPLLGPSSASAGEVGGLCLVGCSDGTLHCLSLSCGMRVGPPLVLGCAVAYADIHCTSSSTQDGSAGKCSYTALAVTAEGEVWKWTIDADSAKFRCAVRTNIRPVLLSMKCQSGAGARNEKGGERRKDLPSSSADTGSTGKGKNGASSASSSDQTEQGQDSGRGRAGVRMKVQQCMLTDEDDIQVHVLAAGTGAGVGASAGAAEGGEWQAFSYDADAQAWHRLADMRHVLSSLFVVKTLGAACGVSPIVNADIADATAPSSSASGTALTLSTLQSMAATGANFGTKDIVGIAAAKQAALHAAMSSMATSGAASGGSLREIHRSAAEGASVGNGGGDKKIAPTAEEWVCLATISHVEDRLAVAQAMGNSEEILVWLSAWVNTCCKNGLTGRLQWLARRLIELHVTSARRSAAANSSTAMDTTTAGTGSSTAGASQRSHSSWDWLCRLPQPLQLLQTTVMPAIAQNPSSHALLAEINHTLELLGLG